MNIEVNVSNKIAKLKDKSVVGICGNSDYVIHFNFDDEWNAHETKTARFKWNGKYTDVVFTGIECAMPIVQNTYNVEVGVYAGNLHTTTSAYLPMKKSILCGDGSPADPTPDVYAQLIDMIDSGKIKGEDGYSPSAKVEKTDTGARVTVTDASGTTYADLTNGKDGKDGAQGIQGEKGADGKDGSDASVTAANIASALGYTPLSSASGAVKTANLASGEQMTKTNVVKALGYTPATQTTVTNVIKNVSNITKELAMKGNYYHWKGLVGASDWADDGNGGYTQTVEIYGITSSDTPHISLVLDDYHSKYSQWQAYKMISYGVVESDNYVLLVCYGECPSEDFSINVEWMRGD